MWLRGTGNDLHCLGAPGSAEVELNWQLPNWHNCTVRHSDSAVLLQFQSVLLWLEISLVCRSRARMRAALHWICVPAVIYVSKSYHGATPSPTLR